MDLFEKVKQTIKYSHRISHAHITSYGREEDFDLKIEDSSGLKNDHRA